MVEKEKCVPVCIPNEALMPSIVTKSTRGPSPRGAGLFIDRKVDDDEQHSSPEELKKKDSDLAIILRRGTTHLLEPRQNQSHVRQLTKSPTEKTAPQPAE